MDIPGIPSGTTDIDMVAPGVTGSAAGGLMQ